jgi:hypothetical protein
LHIETEDPPSVLAELINAKKAADFQAEQLRCKAAEERAAGQRSALERRADAEKVMSRQKALAAASGAGVTGTVLDLLEDTAGGGEYLASSEMFGAESLTAGFLDQGRARR